MENKTNFRLEKIVEKDSGDAKVLKEVKLSQNKHPNSDKTFCLTDCPCNVDSDSKYSCSCNTQCKCDEKCKHCFCVGDCGCDSYCKCESYCSCDSECSCDNDKSYCSIENPYTDSCCCTGH